MMYIVQCVSCGISCLQLSLTSIETCCIKVMSGPLISRLKTMFHLSRAVDGQPDVRASAAVLAVVRPSNRSATAWSEPAAIDSPAAAAAASSPDL